MSNFLIEPQWPAPRWVRAVSTTRDGGVSGGPYASMNLGAACGDEGRSVTANRQQLAQSCGVEFGWLEQCHGTRCIEVGESDRHADASFTRRPGQACVVLTADCLPVLLCHTTEPLVAAVHAGWRGLAGGIIEATLATLDCRPGDLLAWLGPCIGPQQFEVGPEVRAAFIAGNAADAAWFAPGQPDRWLANLPALACARLQRSGVKQVFMADECTVSRPEKFFSYRRDRITGRMATGLWLACE